MVCIDRDWDSIATEEAERPRDATTLDSLAYVLYTSGSSGQPKGVMVEHRGLVNYVRWCTEAYAMHEGNGTLVHSSIAFDLTVTTLLAPLTVGQPVTLVPGDDGLEGLGLALGAGTDFSLVSVTPPHLNLLMHQISAEEVAGRVRVLVLGGEAVEATPLRWWREEAPMTRLINEYGPTETVVGCCAYEVQLDDLQSGPVPIGRPIANTRAYVLDRRLTPVPVGMRGELFIGGHGVARGYLNRPDETARAFLPDPFAGVAGARMYRTGDLARYRPDGNLEFLGRVDNQVKIRGFRIEPGEVESVVLGHPDVAQVAVVAREETPGDRRLVAYVVPGAAGSVNVGQLRSFARQRLPEYMVPGTWVLLDALQLTPHGKIDRQALPVPTGERIDEPVDLVGPQDALQYRLVQIWERVLRVRPIGLRDNFFDLGGHSLLAVRLFAEIEALTGQKLPLSTLFQAPTVEQLSHVLRQRGWTPPWSLLVPIQPGGRRRPFFCVHGFGGGVIDYAKLARHLGPDQTFYAIQARELVGNHAPSRSVEEMAAHYVNELRSFQPEGPYLLGGYSQGGEIAFEMAQRLIREGQQVALLAMLDTHPQMPLLTQLWLAPRDLPHFVRNLPGWFEDFSGLRPVVMRSRLRRKLKAMLLLTLARIPGCADLMPLTLEDVLDDAETVPEERREFMEVHLHAHSVYRGRSYPGRITVFRTAIQPFMGWHDPALRWDRVARDGADVEIVPGSHHDLLNEPYVATLGRRLKPYFDRLAEPEPDGA